MAVSTCGLYDERNDNRTHLINYAVCQHMVTGKHYSHIEKYIKEHGMELILELRISQIMLWSISDTTQI